MRADDPRHGTVDRFFRGCACLPCRQARSRDEKHRRWEKTSGNPRRIDATGSQRRIQALMRLGWPTTELARIGGWASEKELQNILYARRYVYRATAQRIASLYADLCMKRGPSEMTATRAARAGYAPPLAYDDIDDPAERLGDDDGAPCLDEVAIQRVLDGGYVPLSRDERREVTRRMAAAGASDSQIAKRLNMTARNVLRWRTEMGVESRVEQAARWRPKEAS